MLPETLTVGTTLNFATIVDGFPASDGWGLRYRLIPRAVGAAAPITLVGAPDEDDPTLHRVQVTAAASSAWVAGAYSWASWVERSGEVYDITAGAVTIAPDPRVSVAPIEYRSLARKALDDAKEALANFSPTVRSYVIGNRSMTFDTKAEIVQLIDFWKVEVKRETRAEALAKGFPDPNKVLVRVGR